MTPGPITRWPFCNGGKHVESAISLQRFRFSSCHVRCSRRPQRSRRRSDLAICALPEAEWRSPGFHDDWQQPSLRVLQRKQLPVGKRPSRFSSRAAAGLRCRSPPKMGRHRLRGSQALVQPDQNRNDTRREGDQVRLVRGDGFRDAPCGSEQAVHTRIQHVGRVGRRRNPPCSPRCRPSQPQCVP
jgi:hypothetical protein